MAQPGVTDQGSSGGMDIAARIELAKQRTLQMQLELVRLSQGNTTAGSPTQKLHFL